MLLEFDPVDQVYVVAPVAVSVALSPLQMVGLFTAIEIAEPILTEAVAEAEQVPLAPVTV